MCFPPRRLNPLSRTWGALAARAVPAKRPDSDFQETKCGHWFLIPPPGPGLTEGVGVAGANGKSSAQADVGALWLHSLGLGDAGQVPQPL